MAAADVAPVAENIAAPDFVGLTSYDGHEFYTARRYVLYSPTITDMLKVPVNADDDDAAGDKKADDDTKLPDGAQIVKLDMKEMSSRVMDTVLVYLQYQIKYTDAWFQIPPFIIDPDICAEVLYIASFLKI